MYKEITVKNYKCFKDTCVKPLGQLNLIGGMNDVGKTALLEVLWIHHGADNPELPFRVEAFRGVQAFTASEFLAEIFRDFDTDLMVEISSRDDGGHQRTVRISETETLMSEIPFARDSQERPEGGEIEPESEEAWLEGRGAESTSATRKTLQIHIQQNKDASRSYSYIDKDGIKAKRPTASGRPTGVFLTATNWPQPSAEEARRFSEAVKAGLKEDLIEILQKVDERVIDLEILTRGDEPYVHVHLGLREPLPVSLLGQGVHRLFSMAVALCKARNGVLLIDELENGVHHSLLPRIWESLDSLAGQFNVQVFATTHSYECIDAAETVFSHEGTLSFMYHRLDRKEDGISSSSYTVDMLSTALQTEMELRG